MSVLFSPIEFGELKLRNRIIVSPMCQYSAREGCATSWHDIHLGSLAISGAGLLFTEATAVSARGRITPGDLGLYSDDSQAALERVVRGIRENSDIPLGIQLAHAGRKGSSGEPWAGGAQIPLESGGWIAQAPSAIPHAAGETPPEAMSIADLKETKDAFVATAKRAIEIGFQAIEVHAAHGYLLHEFLSPVSNQRADQYGGSRDNRMRYPLEIFAAIREATPSSVPVGLRVSSSDWLEHLDCASWRIDDSIALAVALKRLGCAWIDASSGGISPLQKIPVGPGYQVPFARAIRDKTAMTVIAVGMITDPEQAERIVSEGSADCVALARAMLFDPRWPWRAAEALKATVAGPKQYWRSLPAGTPRIFGDTSMGQR
jgi:2,4-dienoyl-CoA reductase-like NADH-dependent reductase (Old Yellow Enzyme family)